MNKLRRLKSIAFVGLISVSSLLNAQTAKLQAIHNSPHPTAASVDVWVSSSLGTTKLLTDFKFREATPFVDVPAGIPVTVAIALPGSTTINDTVAGLSITATLADAERYVLLAQGNVSTVGYAANPNAINTAFQFIPAGGIRPTSNNPTEVDFLVVHGSPDAPGVDIYARGIPTPIVPNLQYNQSSAYVNVPAGKYILDINVENTATTVFTKVADLSGLAGNAITVFASGYLTPSANNNGPAFGVFAALEDGTVVELQDPKAMVQVIHNSADIAAAQVDIYYNGTLLLDNFAFRAATGFVEVDAEKQISIAVAPSTSTSVADALATFNYTLDDGGKYILVANGVLAPANYAVNPEGRSTAFDILVYPTARQEAEDDTKVELLVLHGATDAPTVDVVTGGAVLVNDLVYSDFQGYLAVDAQSYILGITPGNDNNTVLLRYTADLTGLEGGVATVVASGFLDPSTNQNGEGFALIAVLADGTVITLPTYTPKAMVQVIHNSADVAAAQVDIYYNGTLLLDNFAFRAATGFVEVDAETQISIAVAPSTSTSVADALATFNYTLDDGGKYILVANGVLAPANYAFNPEGRSTAFDILVYPTARQEAEDDTKVELLVLHGATDAPTVDVVTGGAVLVNDLVYSDFQGYLAVDAQSYILGITPGNDNNNVLLRYTADLTGLEGGVATVIASGFLDPSTNQNGEGFALIAVLADGTVITLPTYTPKAMVQVIHNSADVAAAQVDIYYNGTLLLENFAFRAATGFVEVDAETQISIAVAPSTSTSVADALATFNYTLDDGGKYIIVANGVLNPASYSVNPDSKATDFNLFVYADARSEATESDKVDLLVFHGATDAPTVDVKTGGTVLVDDLAYTDFQGYLSVDAASYVLQLTPANDNDVVLFQYTADLSGLAGGSATLIASGFLTPSDNEDGEGFALLAILADGTVINLPISTLSVNNVTLVNATVYPNPTTNSVTLETTVFTQANYRVVNVSGQEVSNGTWSIDNKSISLQNLQNGVYFIELFSNSQVYRTRVQVIK